MLDFVTERSPLAEYVLSFDHRGVGCEDMANAINHSCEAIYLRFLAMTNAFVKAGCGLVRNAVPLDLYIVVGRGAPSQKKDKEESHTPILVQPIGMYKYA
jgi:hypothetical protein